MISSLENKNITILLVDSDENIIEFLDFTLGREGFRILRADSSKTALEVVKEYKPHLIILDIMLPDLDGIETCKQLRLIPEAQSSIILFLTGRGEDYSQIAGFEAGADDYIKKPVNPKVLVCRIQVLLRRYRPIPGISGRIITGEFVVDLDRYIVIKNGEEINFTHKEFELLQLLVSRPNKVYTREDILARIWKHAMVVGDRTINVHIHRIREKIGTARIKTIKNVGYKFEGE